MRNKTLKIQPIITTGYRPLKDGSGYDKYFPKASVVDKMIVADKSASVDDVVEMMQQVVWKYRNDTKAIAHLLKADTLEQSITNIWNFLYHHIQYKLDTSGLEELRRPARLWHDKEGDCDDFAMSASSILTNLKIPHKFRITKYDKDYYQHVYVVVPHSQGYFIIDPVLSLANYEKPFTEKKDFKMNLNGINVAVLSGFGSTDESIIEDMLLSDLDLQGLGSLSDSQADQRMYKYLVSTRAFSIKNRGSIANFENPDNFIKSLDYAIKYWNTPKREEALSVLARNEENENRINLKNGFLSGFDDNWDNIDGLSDNIVEQYLSQDEINGLGSWSSRRKKRKGSSSNKKVRRKKFWGKVKTGLKKVGKTLNRFNPGVAAIRGGILIAMRINMFGFTKRLKWSYASDSQRRKAKITKAYVNKSKVVLLKIIKIFEGMGGKRENLKKAILKGKHGQLKGFSYENDQISHEDLEGLGVISSAAMLTAATTVLGVISKIFKKSKLGKEEKVNSSNGEAKEITYGKRNTAMSKSNSNNDFTFEESNKDYNLNDQSGSNSQESSNSKPPNKFMKVLKDNPVYSAIGGFGILGLSFWGVSTLIKPKKAKEQASIAGPSNNTSRQKSKKSKPKAKSVLKIEKLK